MLDENENPNVVNEHDYGGESSNEAYVWELPTPLPNPLPPVDAFVADLLPDCLRAWVQDIAERMQCPIDYIAVSAIAALSSLAAARVVMQPKVHDDWHVTLNLWSLIIGPLGVKKTPAMNAALIYLESMQKQECENFKTKHAAWKRDMDIQEMIGDENRKKAKKLINDDVQAARSLLEPGAKLDEPDERRYVINDTSVEKLGEISQKNEWGFLAYRDEIYGLMKSLDKVGQEGARAYFLQAFDGNKPYTFDRIGRGTIRIERVCLAMLGGIQPGRIQEYVCQTVSGGSGDDGFLQRFGLTVWPDIEAAYTHVDRTPNRDAARHAEDVFNKFQKLAPGQNGEQTVLRFSAAAQQLHIEWSIALEMELRGNTLHPAMVSHLSKYRKLIPALAAIFTLIDDPECVNIVGISHLQRALAWCKYLRSHANRLYAAAHAPEAASAAILLEKIISGKLTFSSGGEMQNFTARIVVAKGWGGLSTPAEVRAAANLLVEYGWLKFIQKPAKQSGGRPSGIYYINPLSFSTVFSNSENLKNS